MRIAQLAPLAETVPPKLYGGSELVVSLLTEELVKRGHEVTLFASADSETSGRLISCAPTGLRQAEEIQIAAQSRYGAAGEALATARAHDARAGTPCE